MTNEQQYNDWVGSLPPTVQREVAASGDVAPTAYWRAVKAGWSAIDIINDSRSATAKGGLGLVIHRLRNLAESGPPREQKAAPLSTDRFKCYVCGVFTQQKTGDGNEAKGAKFVCHDHLSDPQHKGEPMMQPTLEERRQSAHYDGPNVHEGRYVEHGSPADYGLGQSYHQSLIGGSPRATRHPLGVWNIIHGYDPDYDPGRLEKVTPLARYMAKDKTMSDWAGAEGPSWMKQVLKWYREYGGDRLPTMTLAEYRKTEDYIKTQGGRD